MNTPFEASVSKLVYGGQGLIHHEGKAYLVGGVAPDERIRAHFRYRKKGINWAELEEVIEPNYDQRIQPQCKHFQVCGGCNYQHLSYDAQLRIKEKILQEIFQAQIMLSESLCSPKQFNYRNKCEFTFGENDRGELILGLHPEGKFFEVLSLEECHLLAPSIWNLLQMALRLARESGLSRYQDIKDAGFFATLTVRYSTSSDELLLLWKVKDPDHSKLSEINQKLRESFPNLAGILAVPAPRGDLLLLVGRNTIVQKIDQVELIYQAENFFQINTDLLPSMMNTVLDLVRESGADLIYDLFAGVGAIGIYLGYHLPGIKVICAETDPTASKIASLNAELNCLNGFQSHNLDLFRKGWGKLLKTESKNPCAIVDPPRAGLSTRTIEEILVLAPDTIVYISCNPTTQKRDIDLLASQGYQLQSLRLVDLFPQTYHLESIAYIRRI
ncbi:MAG: 23S rRNA (uracil(1939)-C(5))-methyltransferase RlmD [Candidatus Caenarcaniphilales bacterium]|nr:23S rRNA (uracil(1939)-C(5))-methyltransferase RlmD [Candidatus Caenarcaniphilales bacterium]